MGEYKHFVKKDLPPRTPEQDKLRKKIEHQIKEVSPEEYDNFVLERRRDEFAKSVKDLLKQILDPHKVYKTLEIGAGTGIATNRLNELDNLQVTALDLKKDFLDYGLKKDRIDPSQAVQGNFSKLPFKDETFDLYIGIAVLNQRDDIDKFYQEVIRVLKKGGLIIIPWIKTREKSIEREKAFFQKFSLKVKQEGKWFLVGEK